jgi:hypothetical protein
VGEEVPEDAVDELLDDAAAIDALLLQSLLVEEDDLVLLAQIACHAGVEGVLELIPPADSNYEILVHLLLQEQGAVVILLVLFDELLQLAYPRLEGEDEGQFPQQHLHPSCALPEEEPLQGRTQGSGYEHLGVEFARAETLLVKIGEEVDHSLQL